MIGVVDGYFETVPTVWHKEILWAMSQGIHVYGAASIGALRAAELAEFGMKGVGHIYQQFRAGILMDDDEVAVLHGPAETDYVQVTDAMVNVRATVDHARQSGIVEPAFAAALFEITKSLFYKDRTYEAMLKLASGRGLAPEPLVASRPGFLADRSIRSASMRKICSAPWRPILRRREPA